ncbi:GNAT family N-acetyltransferase [Gammaproteobacteria bacterium]|nr:GNAT family N-acetyltransferase [Gammaproteobacteria bacterium]MDC1149774.1 GNAT family N-acetyltransferase [Gammaproteobacteria bacterium]MDC3313462.1 GNAT family N-acetyltransferase [Gammaproteobacteria bacterium]
MIDNFEIRSPISEEEWERYDNFRWEVLRKPLKMSHIPLKDNLEEASIHLMGVTSEGKILACGRLHLNTSKEAQIRYMGVSEDLRRSGIGSKMIEKLEEEAINQGANQIMLNARENAVAFYKSLGYFEVGPYESDIQIPHTRMEKQIS